MALPFKIKSLDAVAEAFRTLYIKHTDGTYVLEVDGAVDKETVTEFRNKNIELMKEAEKYKDLNPQKYQELMELQRQRQEKELIDKGEVDQVIEGRVKAMKAQYDTEISTRDTSISQMTRQLESLLIDNTVRTAATKTGVRPEAVDDVLLRAKTVFSIKEGKVVALDGEGKIAYGKDGTTPLGIEEWSTGLKTTAPHLYLGSTGGGGSGSGGGSGGRSTNATPISKISAGLDSANFD